MDETEDFKPYELDHLPRHLVERGRLGDLRYLLELETAHGLNAWFEAQDRRQRVDAYLVQLDLADALIAKKQFESADQALHGLRFAYVLMQASVNSRAKTLPADLITRLVRHGLWTLRQTVGYVARIPGDSDFAETLRTLIALGWPLNDDAHSLLDRLSQFDDAAGQARLLSQLVPLIPRDEATGARLLDMAMTLPASQDNQSPMLSALSAVVPCLRTNDLLLRALEKAFALDAGPLQAEVLSVLAPALGEPMLNRAWRFAEQTFSHSRLGDRVRAAVLPALLRRAPAPQLDALAEISDPQEHLRALAGCIPSLDDARSAVEQLRAAVQRLLPSAAQPMPADIAPAVLAAVLPFCDQPLFSAVVAELLARWNRMDDCWIFPGLAAGLDPAQCSELFAAILAFLGAPQGEWRRSVARRNRILTDLLPSIPGDRLEQAFGVARANFREVCETLWKGLDDPALRDAQLTIGSLPTTGGMFSESLKESFNLNDIQGAMRPLIALVQRSPAQFFDRVWEVVALIPDDVAQLDAMAALADHLPPALLRQTISRYLELLSQNSNWMQSDDRVPLSGTILAQLLPRLDSQAVQPFLEQSLATLRQRARGSGLRTLLTTVADSAPPAMGQNMLREALALAHKVGDSDRVMLAHMALFKLLPPPDQAGEADGLRAALDQIYPALEKDSMARRMAQSDRELLLLDLSAVLGAQGRHADAIDCLAEFDPVDRLEGLLRLLPMLDSPILRAEMLSQTLQLAGSINAEARWARACIDQGEALPHANAQDLWQVAQRLSDRDLQAAAYAFLLRHLPSAAQHEVGQRLMSLLAEGPRLTLSTIARLAAVVRELPEAAGWLHRLIAGQRYTLRVWSDWPYTHLQRRVVRESAGLRGTTPDLDLSTLTLGLQRQMKQFVPDAVPLPELLSCASELASLPELEERLRIPATSMVADHVLDIEDGRKRTGALAGLLPFLPRRPREQALDWIFEWLQAQGAALPPLELAQIYLAAGPYSPLEDQRLLAREAMAKCLRSYGEVSRAYGIVTPCDAVVARFALLPAGVLSELLDTILGTLKDENRAHILSAIWVMAPMVCALGGAAGAQELYGGLRHVIRWWPA